MLVHEHLDKVIEEGGDVHRAFNYRICHAVDLTSAGIILDRMERLGLDKNERRVIELAVRTANNLFRQANDRLHKQPLSPVL